MRGRRYSHLLVLTATILAFQLTACSNDGADAGTSNVGGSAKTRSSASLNSYQPVKLPAEALALRTFIRENPASEELPEKVSALYQQVLAMNNVQALSEFSQEFFDFPEGEQARSEMLKLAGLEARHTFREGKIGEKYVPGYSESQYSTETVTIDGKSHSITQRDRDRVTSGYTTDRHGYTAIYQVFNESKQPYVVQVAISGTSTMSEAYVRDSWGSPKGVATRNQQEKLTKQMSFLIDAGGEIKDQIVVGEKKPTDFSFDITDVIPVSNAWMTALRKALEGEADLQTLAHLMSDLRAQPWHDNLARRFTEAASKQIAIAITPGARFDRDFESPVEVTFTNRNPMPVKVDYKPNFTSSTEQLELASGQAITVNATALGVAEESLRVAMENINPMGIGQLHVAYDYAKGQAERMKARAERRLNNIISNLENIMIQIPGGTYLMGSSDNELRRDKGEGPQRQVQIAAFEMGKHEVTFDEWDVCVEDGGCRHMPSDDGWGRGSRPVINVSFNDITNEFIPWLNYRTGKQYRLSSEAEWEYAARAGTATRFHTGDCITTDQANFDGNLPAQGCPKGEYRNQTLPVGSLQPNTFGLYDMHGNVREWTQDCWNSSYRSAPTTGTVRETGNCVRGVLRGGSWYNTGDDVRSAHRFDNRRNSRTNSYGFRLARSR